MPIYEYQCTNCHHAFDLIQKINEPPETTCPNCSTNNLVKLVSAAGFQLKGTGWYATDFKDKKPKQKSTATDAATASTSESKSKPGSGKDSE